MLSALLVTALAVAPAEAPNALSLNLRGRTVTLTAAQLAAGCVSCSLWRVVADSATKDDYTPPPLLDSEEKTPPAGELTPPPDVPSWQTPEEPPRPRRSPPKNGVKYDPHAGEWVPREVMMGGLAMLLTDVLAGTVIGAIVLVSVGASLGSSSSDAAVAGIVLAVGLAILHTLISPIWAAIAVKTAAEEPTATGMGGAILGAYAGALVLGAASIGLLFGLALIQSAISSSSGAYAAVGSIGTLLTLAAVIARWVGVPLAASWALHRGPQAPLTASVTPHPRRPVIVTAEGREARPIGGATVFAF